MDLSTTYTIEQFIKMGSSTIIDYQNLSILDIGSNGEQFITYNVLNDYLDELIEMAVDVTMSDKEYNTYMYKPKLLAYDIYGSQELYFVILAMNRMSNVKEFNTKKIKLINKENIEMILSYIYNTEKTNIDNNRAKLGL